MYELSGSRCGPSGVGTQMMTALHSRSRSKSEVATNRSLCARQGHALRPDVPDVRLAAGERGHLGRIHVEADDREPRFAEDQGQREPHVPLPNHADDGAAPADTLPQEFPVIPLKTRRAAALRQALPAGSRGAQ